ncbi:hypothetical protein O6H91_09G106700 [Diphasiastrum complanatum]|uniref:Uncharacterized protein n=1 Tax=Diphasiastrum complanatum TaxID=34168 RepID=A0ACC2CSQ7_DIPCM|nr:hypothetical protein O6H91_09G106700 [Diphasiastrum complanatum]
MEAVSRFPSSILMLFQLLVLFLNCCHSNAGGSLIGVCYGRNGNNLPPPQKVVRLLKSQSLSKVRLFDSDQTVLQAFANTPFEVVIGVTNPEIPSLALSQEAALSWVTRNVGAVIRNTNIVAIAVGSEVITCSKAAPLLLVPAMKNLYAALLKLGLDKKVKVSTPHSMSVLEKSYPPSEGAFENVFIASIMQPLLEFLAQTESIFMINVYPFYAYKNEINNISLDYALFETNKGIIDNNTGLLYRNLFDAQVDAVFSALAAMGYKNLKVVVSETGWPSMGDATEAEIVNMNNAARYNGNLVQHVLGSSGTPLRPGAQIDTYIFELFNENQSPGPSSQRNWGLFKPDGTKAYDISFEVKTESYSEGGNTGGSIIPLENQTYCVAIPSSSFTALQEALNWACGPGHVDCTAIQPGQPCYLPDTVSSHASYAFNGYYQSNNLDPSACAFSGMATITSTDPSYGNCAYQGSDLSTGGAANSRHHSGKRLVLAFLILLLACLH